MNTKKREKDEKTRPSLRFPLLISEPGIKIVNREDRPVLYYTAPHHLAINKHWPDSKMLLKRSWADEDREKVLPLIVKAAVDSYPGTLKLSDKERSKMYDRILEEARKKDD